MKKYFVVLTNPEAGSSILGGGKTPELAESDALTNCGKDKARAEGNRLVAVKASLGKLVEEHGDDGTLGPRCYSEQLETVCAWETQPEEGPRER